MPRINKIAKGVATAERLRWHIRQVGSAFGKKLWAEKEDAILLRLYPNYAALRNALSNRTYAAIRSRAASLGIQKKVSAWNARQETLMRKLYPRAPREDLLRQLPNHDWEGICSKAYRMKLKRTRILKRTNDRLTDQIRDRATYLNLNMRELDAEAGTGKYFRQCTMPRRRPNGEALRRAVEVLGGELTIIWYD